MTMDRLSLDGIFGAGNALAVTDTSELCYIFDPRVDATIRINFSNNTRDVLKWFDHSFHHRRWLCYCLFIVERESVTFLPTLFYNTKRRQFILITFVVDDSKNLLYSLEENVIEVDGIRLDRFAYNAHKDDEKLHIIFYERFSRHLHTNDSIASSLAFVYCSYDCNMICLTTRRGMLPPGQWELPFVANDSIHFITTESNLVRIASLALDSDFLNDCWHQQPIATDNDSSPSRKAIWCNAWRNGIGWFVVSEKFTNENNEVKRVLMLWQLDVFNCQWRKLPVNIETPEYAQHFALRVCSNSIAYLHCEWDRSGVFFKLVLDDLLNRLPNTQVLRTIDEEEEKIETISTETSDPTEINVDASSKQIICPVCLDNYEDPRTLHCGHSLCNSCIEQMRIAAQSNAIRCFACRKITTIPSWGLPVNFGLRDAVESLEKVRNFSASSKRCSRCRSNCEESSMWICLKCSADDVFENFDANSCDSVAEKCQSKFIFCAECVLKYHSDHRIDELQRFRERCIVAKNTSIKCSEHANQLLKDFEKSAMERIESALIKPLMCSVEEDLWKACDAVSKTEKQLSNAAVEVVTNLKTRIDSILRQFDEHFKQQISRQLSSYNQCGPTEL